MAGGARPRRHRGACRAGESQSSGDSPFILSLMLRMLAAGRWAAASRQPWLGGVVVAYTAAVLVADPEGFPSSLVFKLVFTIGPWLLGLALQEAAGRASAACRRAVEAETSREDMVRRATADERLAIAREIHDVVSHGLSALSLQAQVLRRAVLVKLPARDRTQAAVLAHRSGLLDPLRGPQMGCGPLRRADRFRPPASGMGVHEAISPTRGEMRRSAWVQDARP